MGKLTANLKRQLMGDDKEVRFVAADDDDEVRTRGGQSYFKK
jgi:hypothetical protein